MALSNPTSKTEGIPEEIIGWTEGRAIVATGSPFDPVVYSDRTIPIPQCNNVYVFPGVGLGVIVSGARQVTEAMFAAASETLAGMVAEEDLATGSLYPPVTELRAVSRAIAGSVARVARDSGVGRDLDDAAIEEALDREIWDLRYPHLSPV
jgi:malate dehydrogenase (oxaloacetate-decarboxylating)